MSSLLSVLASGLPTNVTSAPDGDRSIKCWNCHKKISESWVNKILLRIVHHFVRKSTLACVNRSNQSCNFFQKQSIHSDSDRKYETRLYYVDGTSSIHCNVSAELAMVCFLTYHTDLLIYLDSKLTQFLFSNDRHAVCIRYVLVTNGLIVVLLVLLINLCCWQCTEVLSVSVLQICC